MQENRPDHGQASVPDNRAEPGLSAAERMSLAVELLNHGDRDKARAELGAVLAVSPNDAAAARLLREMDEDPQAALGEKGFAYTARPGETMSDLAARFLGDPLEFYLLARYNGIAVPANLAPGNALKIPGAPPHKVPPAPRPTPPASPPALTPTPPSSDQIARAKALRVIALENMNGGRINRAVDLLRQAAELDPASPLVKHDLARAQRIQAAVQRK